MRVVFRPVPVDTQEDTFVYYPDETPRVGDYVVIDLGQRVGLTVRIVAVYRHYQQGGEFVRVVYEEVS